MNTQENRNLPSALSEADIKARLSELEQLNINVGLIDQMEANYAAEIKAARAHNADRIKTVTREIQKRAGIWPVLCEKRVNFAKAHFEVVRLDTGKVIEAVPMTAAELHEAGQNHADVLEGKA